MKGKQIDMTTGKPTSLLIAFALPTLAGNLLHQAYSITDSIVVGQCLGQTALAAVGCTSPMIMLLAALMIGVNTGVGILVSQYFGQSDTAGVRRCFVNSIYLSLLVALAVALGGIAIARPLLSWMGTPAGPLQQATEYLRISFLTSVCPLFYHLFSSVFRGMGDSRTALYCLVVSAAANILLDILFVAVLQGGVAGSAWATALAQGMSAIFAALSLRRKYPEAWPKREDFIWDGRLFCRIAGTAVPIALQSAFNNLSNVAAQSAVNTFGEAAMAAYTAAGRIGTLALMPVETVGSAMSVYAGQNYGARKPDRLRSGLSAALKIVVWMSLPLAVVLLLFGTRLSRLFLSDPSGPVITIVGEYLLIAAVPGVLDGVMQVCQQTLRGIGRPARALAGGVMQLAAKILLATLGAWVVGDLRVVWLGWPLSFAAGSVLPALYLWRHLKSGDGRLETITTSKEE